MKKDGFVIRISFYQPIKHFNNEQLGKLFRSLFEWQLSDGVLNVVDEDIQIAFNFFVTQFKVDLERYREICNKRRDAVEKRWELYNSIQNIQMNTSDTDRIGEDRIGKESIVNNEGNTQSQQRTSTSKFIKPSVQEVQEYCRSKGYNVDADRFVDYYESIGWKIGKNPMKDWKAAVRTWERKNTNDNNNNAQRKGLGKKLAMEDLI